MRALHDEVRKKAATTRADELFRQGMSQAALGDPAAAVRLFGAAINLDPDHRGAKDALDERGNEPTRKITRPK